MRIAKCPLPAAGGVQRIHKIESDIIEKFFLKSSRPEPISEYQISSDNPQKDNFHKLIYDIDKRYIRCIVDSIIRTRPSLSKGVVDGERPLKVPTYKLEFSS
jgi:hypothetical protein